MLKIINGLYNIEGTQYIACYHLGCDFTMYPKLSTFYTIHDNYLPIYGKGVPQNTNNRGQEKCWVHLGFDRSILYA